MLCSARANSRDHKNKSIDARNWQLLLRNISRQKEVISPLKHNPKIKLIGTVKKLGNMPCFEDEKPSLIPVIINKLWQPSI